MHRRHAAIASALALAACTTPAADTPPTTQTATQPAVATAAASPEAQAGQGVYTTFCAACHNGGDERAPELAELHRLPRERIATALSSTGVMKLQGGMLNEQQRTHVVAFLATAPAATQARSGPTGPATYRAADGTTYAYPVRRVRDERDNSDGPRPAAWAAPRLADGPFNFETWEERNVRAVVVARGLTSPRGMEFLPSGELLITERAGALRIVRNGRLEAAPVRGGPPAVAVLGTATGFMDIALHPSFAQNGLIYLSYHKPAHGDLGNNAIWRGRWTGTEIVEGRDIFVGDDVDALYTRLAFGPDGKLYATIGCPGVGTDESIGRAQLPGDFAGKTLRLNDDGTVPRDNPFVGRAGYNPEIFTLGHRVNLGLTLNPWTNEFWVSEHGPNGGDEVNILRRGQNYGWPVISDGRYYSGPKVSPDPVRQGLTRPHISYVPSIAPGGMVFYTGDKFPHWRRNLFVGAMRMSEAPRTGHLQRIVFNENWEMVRSEILLFDLHQRIRDIAQSPTGDLWVVTDEGADSVVMRIEPGT
jgi:glucose/arabinose dehydrogenase/cytochrome c553